MAVAENPAGIADRARQAIQASGMSQRRVARAMGLDETKLSKSLSGHRRFSADEVLALATATGVTAQWLLGNADEVSVAPPHLRLGAAGGETPDDGAGETGEQAVRRRSIVEAAWELFSRHGFEAVRIADIAEAAGISAAGVHYHFAGKDELITAALRYSVKLAFDRQIAWLSDVRDPSARLDRLLEMQSPTGPSGPSEWSIWLQTWNRLALAEEPDPEYVSLYARWSQTVRATIEAGQRTGAFRDGDSRAMADELTSVLDGLGIKLLTGVLDAPTFQHRLRGYVVRSVIRPAESS
jgi:AcrR family transcriptional regulator